ncbi:GNAT family N-acetyltransferase [Streptococcus loxodontisalivarius]|uniref:Ribosomal protein S18 acetylase RimI-like enzyme n=1 Tax=Streptococcus loxodontisalivarius TaxID=1349415 RepID=A0ABS2PSE7_9STRE|nr:GNAT family N-acetyltransferase [Streptococcus loxodontisalivarius]MBM7642920.1 ribosomal protein S18 acetylase RimI-like enzyme [Streptococcus loxodontisalivarius]
MTFPYTIETDPNLVDYDQVTDVLHKAGLGSSSDRSANEKAFKNSDITIFIKDGDKVIGVGRALTDFVSQGAIYNVAVDPDYQKQHVGHTIITTLLEKLQGINIILYTHPQTLTLYEKYGFKRNKTAFSHFGHGTAEGLQWMEDEGFFLPDGYRFESEIGRY